MSWHQKSDLKHRLFAMRYLCCATYSSGFDSEKNLCDGKTKRSYFMM